MKINHFFAALAMAAVSLCAAATQAAELPSVYNPGVMLTGLSDNGVYALSRATVDESVDNPRTPGGVLLNLTNKEQIEISAPSGWADINDVADNGVVVGCAAGKPGYWSPETGQWTTFKVPYPWGGGSFTAVTPDAHYAVGYYTDIASEFNVSPMMYDLVKGEAVNITNLPKVDLSGEDQHQNVFYGISPDGRYVLGQMSQSYWLPVSLFSYIYDVQNNTWKPIGYDYDETTMKYTARHKDLHFIVNQYMSCNGKWVTGGAYVVHRGSASFDDEGIYTYRYDVENDVFELYDGANDASVMGNKITNDGVVLASSPADNPYPTAMIRYGSYFISLDQAIEQNYGIAARELVHDDVTGTYQCLAADGRTAIMSTYDNSYVLKMPDDFARVAANVDLLGTYSLNIPQGSTISRVSEVKLTFDRPVECSNQPKEITLLDSKGKTVRNASGIAISPNNDHMVVVTFRSTNLNADEKYTIDIPAGMIWIKDDASVKSKNIQIHYIGREEGAIKMLKALPADGMSVTQFNSNPDYLSLTFNTPVAISSAGQCTLYNADDNTVIANFNASVDGNTAYFFPTATYALYKGSNYRVVISAGTVTDLSGSGGCEEIVLNYKGSYVRELSADDIYIFNAPCDSYDNFMFWSSETNTPAAIPASWGFEADNPWLLVRDSESSDDWALAAHSMFAPAGESDDWLITPQLYIPDANTYLAFDAQSYMHSKDDNLKVYIYNDDAIYNYFSSELADMFKTNGDLVFDEIVPAGATDEGLNDEWTRYTVALDKYAGKNIYIAFVYNNYDKSAIFIDDIQVVRNMSFLITNQTPSTVVDVDNVTVLGLLSVGSEVQTFKGVNIKLVDADGVLVDEINDENATITHSDVYKFAFAKPLQLTVGDETRYVIEVRAGDETMSYVYTVKDLMFSPVKKVVLEEYTGSACPNCPLGIQTIENLQALFPDNFIAITLRTYQNDMYGMGLMDYTQFLGLNAAPTGRINRGAILAPMIQNGSKGYEFFGRGIVQSDGTEAYLWADAVQDALSIPAEAEVSFTSTYDENTGNLEVPCKVRFALNRKDANIGVFAVVLEDNLPTYQLNNFSTISDSKLGEWGTGGIYSQYTVVSWLAMDVARYVVNDQAFNGTQLPDSDIEAGKEYDLTLSATVPNGRLSNVNNCKVVVMLIDRGTGAVINASESRFNASGITDIESDGGDAQYYNLQGIKVVNPERGNIYIRVVNGNTTKIRY